MARYSKIFFVFIILVLSLWLIPWFYHFMTAQPIRNPFTLYSCIIDDFACLDYSENKGVQYKDRNGHPLFQIVSSTAYCLSFITISSLPTAACRTA